jgi:glutamine synthetase
MLLFAPNLNSYRRFQRGTHAPLAPSWGYENRTVAVRVPADEAHATRIEHRVAGADANPYLVVAAILAGILHGIENDLEAPAALASRIRNSSANISARSFARFTRFSSNRKSTSLIGM